MSGRPGALAPLRWVSEAESIPPIRACFVGQGTRLVRGRIAGWVSLSWATLALGLLGLAKMAAGRELGALRQDSTHLVVRGLLPRCGHALHNGGRRIPFPPAAGEVREPSIDVRAGKNGDSSLPPAFPHLRALCSLRCSLPMKVSGARCSSPPRRPCPLPS